MPNTTPLPDQALADATAIVRSAQSSSTLRPQVRAFFDEATFTVTYVEGFICRSTPAVCEGVAMWERRFEATARRR